MRKIISSLLIFALIISGVLGAVPFGTAHASESSNDPSDRERQETHRGILDEFGSDFVVMEGFRYRTSPRVVIKNQQREIVPLGMKALKPHMMIELILEGHLVVQIQIVSLPR